MKFGKFAKAFAPLAALAVAAAVSGCDGSHIRINGDEGKALSELDMTGDAPHELVLMGPDKVEVTEGAKLAITVDGAPEVTELLRFTLKDGTLGILRKDTKWNSGEGVATVNVTMPAPREIVLAGSGQIRSAALDRNAKITVAGSGKVETPNVAAESLDVTIAGSGDYVASGTVRDLKMSIAGSGDAAMDSLKAESAKIDIAGSGRSAFASDGNVKANIMGSGEVRVRGRATCKVSSMGSGKLVCEAGTSEGDAAATPTPAAPASPAAVAPPAAPESPAAPKG